MFDFLTPKVPQIDSKDAYKAIQEKEDLVILDVRTPQEYSRERIAGSINLPLDKVQGEVEKLIPDKDKKVFVNCLSGSRSVMAVDTMVKLGHKNVFDIKNGILAWRVNNLPLVKS